MGVQGIEYGHGHERLERLLLSIDRPGTYCVGGRMVLPMPRLVVDGVGDLSFPVPPTQIEALLAAAQQAPHGKGTYTLVDTSVRDCRQIDARNVRVLGRAWRDSLAKVMDVVADGLGLPAERLGAELYKLLLYEKGGFFAEHRDTEKVPGMVATLTLSLPTAGAGGEIVVRHKGRETTFDLTAREPSELAFAAFYADCPHEVLPVREGHRVSLVFNLFLDSGRSAPGAPDYGDLVATVADCLEEWRRELGADDPSKIVWLLDHEYSEEGLSFAALKNTDAAVARVLAEAAERVDWDLHAAVLRIAEYGTPEFDYWGADDDEDAEMGEVHDRWTTLDGWVSPDGGRPGLGEIPRRDGELLPSGGLEVAEPDERRLSGSTGNEGPTLELTYRLAALVLWPREKAIDVVLAGGIDGAVAWAANRVTGKSEGDNLILERLIEQWPVDRDSYRHQDRAAMVRLLATAGTAELAVGFLRHAVLRKYDGSENEALAETMCLIGAAQTGEFLETLVRKQLSERPAAVVELLTLAEEVADQDDRRCEWRDALREPVRFALTGIEAALRKAVEARVRREADRRSRILAWGFARYPDSDPDLSFGRGDPPRDWIDSEAVRDLFLLARPLDLADEALAAARAIGSCPEVVTPDRLLPAALEGMCEDEELARSEGYAALWKQAADFLLKRSSAAPAAPGDWTIAAEVSCDCSDCSKLRAFCRDSDRRVGRFSVRKDRRKHLHRMIDVHRLDLDHVTERRGSPYTLVLTKNRKSYQRRCREYEEDLRWMALLRQCAPSGKAEAASAERLVRLAGAVAAGSAAGGR